MWSIQQPSAPKFEPLRFNLQRFVIRICKRWQTITETGSVSSIVNLLSPFATARQINVSQLLSNGIPNLCFALGATRTRPQSTSPRWWMARKRTPLTCARPALPPTGFENLTPEQLQALSVVGKKCEFCGKAALSGEMTPGGGAIYWCSIAVWSLGASLRSCLCLSVLTCCSGAGKGVCR